MARGSSRFWLWTLPLVVGACTALVLASGFVFALRGSLGEPIGEPPPPPKESRAAAPRDGTHRILVVGDSLAKGTGDESGKGFALDVLDAMKKRGPAELTNLGVNGMESPEVRTLVETSNVRALAAGADLILVSAGGNDLSHSATRGSASPTDIADAVADGRARYLENLREILAALRAANPKAPIVVIGLYDPFGGSDSGPGRLGSSVILQWNTLLSETAFAYPDVFVVPTFDLFQGRPDRLAADRYHPNRAGYAEIARRILQVAPGA